MTKEQDRRRRERLQRQKQRRQSKRQPIPFTPTSTGEAPLPGAFGWLQRNGRLFYLVGILVMVLSLGAFFVSANLTGSDNVDDINADAAAAEDALADDEPGAAGDDAADDTEDPDAAADDDDSLTGDADGEEAEADAADAIRRDYAEAPAFTIDPTGEYIAVLRTEKGDVTVELLPQEAPIAVNNFVFLADNHFFDGLTFHRVIKGFVAQAGDPSGTGFGGSGYDLDQDANDLPLETGVIAMAKGEATVPTTSGSQFFITLEPQPTLEANFTVFGRVIDGMEVVQALTVRSPEVIDAPPGDLILAVEITARPTESAE